MKNYISIHPWEIIEDGFHPQFNRVSESIFSLGNGRMGGRGNFEERYSGDSFPGNYIAGVYYPDKTRVGWWKIGYPEYFAKVINSCNWIGLDIEIGGEPIDIATGELLDFKRILNMKEGYLLRTFRWRSPDGKEIEVVSQRFYSMKRDEVSLLRYKVKAVNFSAPVKLCAYLDGDVANEDSNYDEKFWLESHIGFERELPVLRMETKKTAFQVASGMNWRVSIDQVDQVWESNFLRKEKYVSDTATFELTEGAELCVTKYVAQLSSLNHHISELDENCRRTLEEIAEIGFDKMLSDQKDEWAIKWEDGDIVIEGDHSAQQGIRFNIFQLHQTYTGKDERLNIGPKGFTGEKYGGVTYWDTEAYCLPFFLSTAPTEVARNLLIYRFKHLNRAIENAEKLGFTDGAALYPMVTMNGEECHNEWEITFEEIHRNGAIAYAIYDYIRYTGDEKYLDEYGLEVLIAIARFWSQRVNWSEQKSKYVILGVTGPNEFENNVNNNWYTNKIAAWCLQYAIDSIKKVQQSDSSALARIIIKLRLDRKEETERWADIVANMYYPSDSHLGIYLQQDGYLDKEQILVEQLAPHELPIVQNWSWDRILRSCFIKQADVLQGIYFFEEEFEMEEIEKNFNYYEPRTVHESSLSPCVHSILAAKLGKEELAYQMYLRTSRLDLDDYNNDTEDGLHITSMGGTWMSVIKGFAGMRIHNHQLIFNPMIPKSWNSYSFKMIFRATKLKFTMDHDLLELENLSEVFCPISIYGESFECKAGEKLVLKIGQKNS